METQNMQPRAGSNKKLISIIIIAGVVVLLIIGFVVVRLMGYGAGIGNSTQTDLNNQSQVIAGSNVSMPSSWSSDAPANYSGAKILFSGNSNPEASKSGAALSYILQNVSVQAVADYYQSSLVAQGWKIEGNANMGGQMIVGAKKDTRRFAVSILDNGNGTVTVTAGLEL